MRSRIVTLCLSSVFALGSLACDYEFKDAPPPTQGEEEVPPEGEVAPEEEVEKNESGERPELAPGKLIASNEAAPKDFKKVNVLDLVAAGKAAIESSSVSGDRQQLFDGSDESLVRTDGINPLKLTVTFTEPIKLRGARVLSTYSDYNWSMTAEGGERLVVEAIPEGVPSVIILPAPIATKKVSFEVLRKTRDNFVHLNEIELFE